MTLQERTEKIEAFRACIINSPVSEYNKLQQVWDDLFDYLLYEPNLPTYHPIYSSVICQYYKEIYLTLASPKEWDKFDDKVIKFINYIRINSGYKSYRLEYLLDHWMSRMIYEKKSNLESMINLLSNYGVTEFEVWDWLSCYWHLDKSTEQLGNYTDNEFITFLIDKTDDFINYTKLNTIQKIHFFRIIARYKPEVISSRFTDFIKDDYNPTYFRNNLGPYCQFLLETNAKYYEKQILFVLENSQLFLDQHFYLENAINLHYWLRKYLPDKYEEKKVKFSYFYFENLLKTNRHYSSVSYPFHQVIMDNNKHNNSYIIECLDIIINQLPIRDAINYIHDFFIKYRKTNTSIVNFLYKKLKTESVPLFFIFTTFEDVGSNYWETSSFLKHLFETLETFEVSIIKNHLLESIKSKYKNIRTHSSILIVKKLGVRIIPEAEKLLNDKKAEIRQTAALILTLLNSEQAQAVLMNAIDSEKNDDARDIMLEGVVGWLASQVTQEAVLQRVAKAKTRGKLEKPLEWWLDETQLPALYWQDSQKSIDSEVVRFLCYRMSRAKDIRTDPEAKPLLALIDRQSSGAFAKNLLKLYFDNGGDAKYKFCLTLGGLLGDDDSSELLQRKVNDWADNGRQKMAEYAVKALALQGSNKALRAVEFFSRKYKNKYKNIGAAAHEAFGIAAEELGISPYDLADSIIPDFGFEGLFREFEVDGETYRAFINTDFKMVFLNEDNRLLKSPPKGISKELAEEFKDITKEIRDIVKSQSSRLEQYLVIQRKWETEKWQAFFLQNPVMFAYAVRLIWGAYDADGHLKFTFRCEQDQTLLNAEGEEAELDEDLQIGMVHPISLSPAQIDYWNGSLYDADIEPIFPQLNRKVITLPEGDKPLVISNEFKGVKYGGYGFTSKMEKLGWYRGSVVDAGWISSFYKDFAEANITAIINQQGELSVGDPSAHAELSELMFVKRNQVSFGSYVYDEPSNANDARLVPFGDLPPIVYSEVMADMQFFKDNQLKD